MLVKLLLKAFTEESGLLFVGHPFRCRKVTKESAVLVLLFFLVFSKVFWVVHVFHNYVSHVT